MPRTGTLVESHRGGRPPEGPELPFGGGDPDSNPDRGSERSLSLAGILVGMVASLMTFAALASTLVLRHALSRDWVSLPIPRILYWNTGMLLASSAAIELARHALNRHRRAAFNGWWWLGTALGAGFLAGQIVAWLGLKSQGVYLAANPSHSMFYVLTWTHAAHAIAGLIALVWIGIAAVRYRLGPGKRTGVLVSSVFWHFLDVMWLGLMVLFRVWG